MRRLVLSFICLLSITTANAGKVITLPDSVAEGYIAFGERYLHKPWAELPDSVFAQFKKMATALTTKPLSLNVGVSWLRW